MKNLGVELQFYKSQFEWWLKYEGLRMALLRSVARVIRVFGPDIREQSWFPKEMERGFDETLGVDTSAFVLKDELDIEPLRKEQSHRYIPTSAPQFRQVMSSLQVELSKFTFIDYGSGKGKTLILASELGFQKIIGIELSHALHAIAQDNIKKRKLGGSKGASTPVCVNEDAARFTLPASPSILYFYNPFNREVMQLVVAKIEQSLSQYPRPLFVVYNNPAEKELFDISPAFRPASSNYNGRWLTYKSAGAPA